METIAQKFAAALDKCLTPSHYIQYAREVLLAAGYTEMKETEKWEQIPNKFFVTRDNRQIFAINKKDFTKGIIVGTRCDAQCFKSKPRSIFDASGVDLVRIAPYGSTADWELWRDRDLRIAGRVLYKDGEKVKNVLYQSEKSVASIVSLAIHMCRGPNAPKESNLELDFNPILELTSSDPQLSKEHSSGLVRVIAEAANTSPDKIIDFDCHFVDAQNTTILGLDNGLIMGSRLESLLTAIVALHQFATAPDQQSGLAGFIVYDSTCITGNTRCGPKSTLLSNTLDRIGAPPEFKANSLFIASTDISAKDQAAGSGIQVRYQPDQSTSTANGPYERLNKFTSANEIQTSIISGSPEADAIGTIVASQQGMAVINVGIPAYSGNAPRQTINVSDLAKLDDFYNKLFTSYLL
ncbi:hypothetical protein TVAG_063330 [Trichomonas vaginalis G3]|uniref:aspartyl aminopeptidase n=1 Tax=Trichomonas vaginalis (strain ATCC PRA-98 / G3) TaxID=412133 RepID=A2G5K3_TRIV3|nr:aminopeptidase protein [Trichomonas vaginalis G3]EAX87564.1 hypothetical protein TVAG_063330 [Trichomonas vaginalis G3]KAI5485157.1 aminopeptidase protein [Trichomonas vaginalis G3]|eukprot:XP_001300494.1 hypothetical protein [Trichomonas vaginalis G3]